VYQGCEEIRVSWEKLIFIIWFKYYIVSNLALAWLHFRVSRGGAVIVVSEAEVGNRERVRRSLPLHERQTLHTTKRPEHVSISPHMYTVI
jgi:hypothetical protein